MVLMRCVAIIQWQLKLMVSNGVSVFLLCLPWHKTASSYLVQLFLHVHVQVLRLFWCPHNLYYV